MRIGKKSRWGIVTLPSNEMILGDLRQSVRKSGIQIIGVKGQSEV